MKPQITKAEAKAFKARWEAVNAAEREELQRTSMSDKLRQLAALMVSGRELGWTDLLMEDETEVWERWNRLRKAYQVGQNT